MTKSTIDSVMTTHEVAARFNELARQEKWFEIQDELFADNVRSIDPPNSPVFWVCRRQRLRSQKRRRFCEEDRGCS